MKILLVNPPQEKRIYSSFSFSAPILPPLGLGYLASALLDRGDNVKIIDCPAQKISYDELKKRIISYSPEIVGVTSTTPSFPSAKRVIDLVKSINKNIITVLGGAHITACPYQTMKECKSLDIGVIGEGELTIVDLVDKIERGLSLRNVDGIIFREKKIIKNKPRSYISDLDSISPPAWHLFNIKLYSHHPLRGRGRVISMITSRGCPYNCYFCDQSVFGHKWRCHSVDYIIREIKKLKERYGINFISFEDDNFALGKKRIVEFCKKIVDEKIDINWGCSLRANVLDREALRWMEKAGCWNIYIGIESGSQRILKYINKRIRLKEVESAVKLIKEYKINVYGSFIIGFPTETKEEIDSTIRFALSLPLDGISLFLFTPYPNTKLFRESQKYGKLSKDLRDYSAHPKYPAYVSNGLTSEYLLKKQKQAYRMFYLRPSYILKHLHRLTDFNFLSKALKAFFILR